MPPAVIVRVCGCDIGRIVAVIEAIHHVAILEVERNEVRLPAVCYVEHHTVGVGRLYL